MSGPWERGSTFGDTEEEVRAAHEQRDAIAMQELRAELVEAGMPQALIAKVLQNVWAKRAKYLDAVIPEIMQSMLDTAPPAMRLRIVPKD